MDATHKAIVRQTLAVTLACIAASVGIMAAVTFLVTGAAGTGLELLIAVLAPAVIAPITVYKHISLAERLRVANHQLRALSETDPLTQTYNRRRFLEVAEQHLVLAKRHCFPTSLLLIDFDHFKQINDQFGHATGDQVLVEATQIIATTLRESDTLARFGGEEFIVLLPHTAREGALMVADRITSAIRDHTFHHEGEDVSVTVSIGGVTCEISETSLARMTSKADSLLYDSKQAGRDGCMVENIPGQTTTPLRDARNA